MAEAVLASVDGRIMPPGDATISILDEGLLRGDGAFEVIKLYGGHPFRLEEHLARLERSAAAIELELDLGALRDELAAVLAQGAEPDGCLRIVATRGARRLLTVERTPQWGASAKVATVTLAPSEILAGVKSISYAANMQANRIAAARGAEEALLVRPDGVVLEAPTSSIFWASDEGELWTPSLAAGILDSITRAVVVAALDVAEGELTLEDLLSASEAFLASTTREIQPISAIDDRELPEVDGAGTRAAAEALRSAIASERPAGGAPAGA